MYALCQGQLPMAIHGHRKYDPEFFAHTILPAASSYVFKRRALNKTSDLKLMQQPDKAEICRQRFTGVESLTVA